MTRIFLIILLATTSIHSADLYIVISESDLNKADVLDKNGVKEGFEYYKVRIIDKEKMRIEYNTGKSKTIIKLYADSETTKENGILIDILRTNTFELNMGPDNPCRIDADGYAKMKAGKHCIYLLMNE